MIRYVLQRVLAMVPTLFGITLITFTVISMAPGDPVQSNFSSGGAGTGGEDGSGGDQDRLADAIKAKKQLLGIMAEDRALLRYTGGTAATGQLVPWSANNHADLEGTWARSLAQVGDTTWSGDDTGAVRSFSSDGSQRSTFSAHTEAIWALAVDETHVATADKLGDIAIFSHDGTEIGRIAGDGKPVRSMSLSNGMLYAASDSLPVREIDPAKADVIRSFDLHIGATFAVLAHDGKLYSGGVDRALVVTELSTGQEAHKDESHKGPINDIEITADGRWLGTAADDRTVRRFELTAGIPGEPVAFEGHYKKATAVALSADGNTLYSGSADEILRTWDATTGAAVGMAETTSGSFSDLVLVNGEPVAAGKFWYKVPVWKRYFKWLGRTMMLDFGRSFVDDEKVIDKIARALPITIYLNLIAIVIIYGVSIPLGVYAAVRRGKAFDNISSVVLFVLYSIPNFWLATMLIMFLSSPLYFDIFPSGKLHGSDPWSMTYLPWLVDWIWHLVLPVTVMVYAGFASLSRYVRTSMLEALSQDFVRTARAKGLAEFIVVGRHALRNALITIVTLLGNLLPRLIGGSVIVEYIFSIDGMGKLGFDAILSRDYPLIMAITTFAALLTLLGILVSDLLYGVADPRVRVNQ